MARRTVPPAAGQPAEGAPSHEDIRTVGWSAFTNWATFRQVIQALDYDLGHACPWRKLGVPKLEGPIPSASYLDMRLRKVFTLLQAGAAAEWTAEDRSTAEQAITAMQTASGTVAEALPEVIRARSQERIGLAPAHAEPSPAFLRYLDGLAAQQGPTWQVAAMPSNVQAMNLADFSPSSRSARPGASTRIWSRDLAKEFRRYGPSARPCHRDGSSCGRLVTTPNSDAYFPHTRQPRLSDFPSQISAS